MSKRLSICTSLAVALLVTTAAVAERGDDADRKSKNGRAEGVIDGVSVVIEYGRPNANERQIWGGLVPFGKVWRTGADEATTISFDRDVTVESAAVAAGTYALFTVPSETDCKILFNSVADQWGAFDYDAGKDVASVSVPAQAIDDVETFEITVGDEAVTLAWADRACSFAVSAASTP
jgi:hypothetical protein